MSFGYKISIGSENTSCQSSTFPFLLHKTDFFFAFSTLTARIFKTTGNFVTKTHSEASPIWSINWVVLWPLKNGHFTTYRGKCVSIFSSECKMWLGR